MHLVIFESAMWSGFAPLTFTRPVCALASGSATLLARQLRRFKPDRLTLWVRPQLADAVRQHLLPQLAGIPTAINEPLDDQPALLLNGSAIRPLPPKQPPTSPHVERDTDGQIALACLIAPGLCQDDPLTNSPRWLELTELATGECSQQCAHQLADLIHENPSLIAEDFADLQGDLPLLSTGPFHATGWDRIRASTTATIAPGVVLDASAGPIIIGDEAVIGANSVVEGPCCIGPRTLIRPLSLIRGGTTLGPSCKIGGDVAESIVQANSNKVHDGYLGHSFVGEWVNLGAGTTTSNLKNTYGPVSLKVGSREINTGRIFMGSVIGDYTKTAIGTQLMTGSYLGVSSMVAVGRHAPRFVGSFRFLTDEKNEPYTFGKAVEVAMRVFARRDRPWTATDEAVLRNAQEMAMTIESV